jgi:hypothetical protein
VDLLFQLLLAQNPALVRFMAVLAAALAEAILVAVAQPLVQQGVQILML